MEEIGIYIHIPFCESKCYYCHFISWKAANKVLIDTYFDKLVKEINLQSGNGYIVKTVYFGGGTPSYVDTILIKKVLEALEETFDFNFTNSDIEKTIEVNPSSMAKEKVEAYKLMGFNRISIGYQTHNDLLLANIGRTHRQQDFLKLYEMLSDVGFKNISADIMYGLPEQTLEDVIKSAEILFSLENIKHISTYFLNIEENTVFFKLQQKGHLNLPSEDLEREMCYTLRERLTMEGFYQYEISNYAKPGYESKHNSSYWDLSPYLGFGISAASFINGKRFVNTCSVNEYLKEWKNENAPPLSEKRTLSLQHKKQEYIFLGLRLMKGIKDGAYQQLFGSSFFDEFGGIIDDLLGKELIYKSDDRIALTYKGQDFSNYVFMSFI